MVSNSILLLGEHRFDQQKALLCPGSCSCFSDIKLLTIHENFLKKLPQLNKTHLSCIIKHKTFETENALSYRPEKVIHFHFINFKAILQTMRTLEHYKYYQVWKSFLLKYNITNPFSRYLYSSLISTTAFIFCRSFLLSPFNVYPFKQIHASLPKDRLNFYAIKHLPHLSHNFCAWPPQVTCIILDSKLSGVETTYCMYTVVRMTVSCICLALKYYHN